MSLLGRDCPQAARQKGPFRVILIKEVAQNLVPEFVVKIVSWETKRPIFSAVKLAGQDWHGKKSKYSWGEINKNRTLQGFEGDKCNELREKLKGMSGIIKAITTKKVRLAAAFLRLGR